MARELVSLDPTRVRSNVERVRERIAAACERSGRSVDDVELLAATKYVPVDEMAVLADSGLKLVGENQAQSLHAKYERWKNDFTFDFIGHLQSRKAKLVVPLVRLIHSIDSLSAVRRIDQHATERIEVLLEINVSGEQTKYGIAPNDAESFLEQASGFANVVFAGLMTMPPPTTDAERTRRYFVALRKMAEELDRQWADRQSFSVLSMGTSQDFEIAVEEGATLVRLGNVLYM